jgi:processive 1,2-diacylglycerol beta-glucosyltransferase
MRLSILSCNYGGGHRRVAETIAAEWHAQTGAPAEIVDYFARFTGPFFERVTRACYYHAIRRAPALQARFYDYMGRLRPESRFRRAVNRSGMAGLARYLAAARPDAVCCVHWTFAGTMSDLKRAGRTAAPCLTVLTDYAGHGQWIHPCIDRYAVPHEAVRGQLLRRGVPDERVAVTGLPVERKFAAAADRADAGARLGLAPGIPVVLVMAGAHAAVGRMEDVAPVLASFPRPIQPVVVCAHAPRLAQRVREAAARSRHPFRVYGYVDNVEELMAAADVLVTKAGGVTIAEALVRRVPMLLYGSIPGHEEANTRFAVAQGVAAAAATPAQVDRLLHALLAEPERLAAMRRAAAAAARPAAAAAVVAELRRLAAGGPALRAHAPRAPAAVRDYDRPAEFGRGRPRSGARESRSADA